MADGLGTSIDVKIDATGVMQGIKDAEKYLKLFPDIVTSNLSNATRAWDKSGKEILTIQSKNAAEGLKIVQKYVRDTNGEYQNVGKNIKINTEYLDKMNQQMALAEKAARQVAEITRSKQFGSGGLPTGAQPGQIASFQSAQNALANFAKASEEHGAAVNKVWADIAAGRQRAYGAGTLEAQASAKLQNMTRAFQDMGKAAWGAYTPIELIKHVIVFGYAYQLWYSFIASIKQGAKNAEELGQRIAEIRTISQGSQLSTPAWAAGITNISNQFGVDAIDVAKAAYETLSNQVAKGAESFNFVGQAALFAKTTVATNAEAVDLLTGAINAYGMKSTDASRISAELFKTIDLGRVRASDMAQSFGQVAIQAEQLGVSFEDMLGIISSGTRKGIKYDELATQLRGVMTALIKPSEAMKTALREMGADSAQAAVQMFGLPGVVDRLAKSTGGASEEMARLFPNVRGMRLFMGLAGEGAQQLADDIRKIKYDSLTEFGNAATDMMSSQSVKVAELNTQVKNYFMEIGDNINVGKAWVQDTIGGTNAITGLSHAIMDAVVAYGAMKAVGALGGISGITTSIAAPFIAGKEAMAAARVELEVLSRTTTVAGRTAQVAGAGFSAFTTSLKETRVAALALSAVKFTALMAAIEGAMYLFDEATKKVQDFDVNLASTKRVDLSSVTQAIESYYGKMIDTVENRNREVSTKFGDLNGALNRELDNIVQSLTGKKDVIAVATGGLLTDKILKDAVGATQYDKLVGVFQKIATESTNAKAAIIDLNRALAEATAPVQNLGNQGRLTPSALVGERIKSLNALINERKDEIASPNIDIHFKASADIKNEAAKVAQSLSEAIKKETETLNRAQVGGISDVEVEAAKANLQALGREYKQVTQWVKDFDNANTSYTESLKAKQDEIADIISQKEAYKQREQSENAQRNALDAQLKKQKELAIKQKEAAADVVQSAGSLNKTLKQGQIIGLSPAAEQSRFWNLIPFSKGSDTQRFYNGMVQVTDEISNLLGAFDDNLEQTLLPKKTVDAVVSRGEYLLKWGRELSKEFNGSPDLSKKIDQTLIGVNKNETPSLQKRLDNLKEINKQYEESTKKVKEYQGQIKPDAKDALSTLTNVPREVFNSIESGARNALIDASTSWWANIGKNKPSAPIPVLDTTITEEQRKAQAAQQALLDEEQRKRDFARQQEQLQYQEQQKSINTRQAALQEAIRQENTRLNISKEQTRLMETQNRLSKEQSQYSDKIALLQLQEKLYGVDNSKEIADLQYKSDKAQEEALKDKIDKQGASAELARKQAAEEMRAAEVARQNQRRQQQEEAARIQNDKVRLEEEQRIKQSQYAGQEAAQNLPEDNFGFFNSSLVDTTNILNKFKEVLGGITDSFQKYIGAGTTPNNPINFSSGGTGYIQELSKASEQQQQSAITFQKAAELIKGAGDSAEKQRIFDTGGSGYIQMYSRGGNVKYLANGGPSGTDTVPAWLTPGEFVVNAKSASKHRALLERINNPRYYANGGYVDWDAKIQSLMPMTIPSNLITPSPKMIEMLSIQYGMIKNRNDDMANSIKESYYKMMLSVKEAVGGKQSKYFANGGVVPQYLASGGAVMGDMRVRPMSTPSTTSSKTQYFNTGGIAVNISNNGSNGISRSQALNIGSTIAGELKRGTLKFVR